MFVKLTQRQIQQKASFIKHYLTVKTAADGAVLDANANVTHKNIATLEAEINKDINIQVNRHLVSTEIAKLFGSELAEEYERQIENHEIYVHDETSLKPYCVSISMYPFLLDGLTKLGGESKAPKHLDSFCGSFVNLVFAISSQFAGAVATVEFLLYFDYFARKDYGDDYIFTHESLIANHLQHVVYAVNQPAAARGYQSVFWNISLYDQEYYNTLFGDFVFPDLERPSWESVSKLQAFFLSWIAEERKKAILTFPVITAAMLIKDKKPLDSSFAYTCATEIAAGNSFFIYMSESADSLASCCRLRSEFADNTFSYSLGAGGVSTGSINVITINMNRLIQDKRDIKVEVEKIQKYQVAYRKLMEQYLKAGMLTAYTSGFITLDKQFLTIGINGMVEAAESTGIVAGNNDEYKAFINANLKVIYDANKAAKKTYGYMFNTEFVPAENLGVKNATWDKKDGYLVSRDCYNSYFYIVEDETTNVIDKFVLHGKEATQYLDGGSALHLNLDESMTVDGMLELFNLAAKTGCSYWTTNVKLTICNVCNHIDKKTLHACSSCSSTNVDWATRIIGYVKRVSAFGKGRQVEESTRFYHIET